MKRDCFSGSYAEARSKFLERVHSAHAGLSTYSLPPLVIGGSVSLPPSFGGSISLTPSVEGAASPPSLGTPLSRPAIEGLLSAAEDQALTIDIAWLGPPRPRAALIITSGTHGVEGFAGSAFQCSLLEAPTPTWLGADVAVILVHALNPFGFSNACRVNEQNIDLNRNFIDFSVLPESPAYDDLHAAIVPSEWTGAARSRADRFLSTAWETLGERGFQQAVCLGQYTHPDGLFYGGKAPSWSNVAWRDCLARLPRSIETLAHIDIHTGLGPYGHGELVYSLPASDPAHALASEWYDGFDLRTAGSSESAATSIGGTMNHAILEADLDAEVTSISLEFGTVDFRRLFAALRADNWLRNRAPPGFAGAAEIRDELLSCFFPADAHWRDSVIERCSQVLMRTLRGLHRHLRTTQRKWHG